jgi:hypothetical protein
VTGVKIRSVNGLGGWFKNSLSKSFTAEPDAVAGGHKLALWALRRYISVEFPDKSSGSAAFSR